MTDKPARIGKVRRKGRENVVHAGIITRLDLSPSQVLARAAEHGLDAVVVIGRNADGEYFASSVADGGDVLWMIERCRKALLSTAD